MKIFIIILGFILFAKCFFFWLWLWQLKEYHFGRFRAHFETQAIKKILSCFWRLKFPKFTKKIIVISSGGILSALLIIYFIFSLSGNEFYFILLISIFFVPLFSSFIILIFQIPTAIWRRRILQKARQKRGRFKNLLVIGIAGSYGKTSTKEFLYAILSSRFKVLRTKENQNSEVGISRCILNDLKLEHEIFICEMGAYNRGGIKLLCSIAKPKIGILTGINEQHMATFGFLENIIKTKYELIESLPEDGVAFFNAKNKYCLELYQRTKIRKFLYGENAKFPGEENIFGAMAAAKELGMGEEGISQATSKIENKIGGIRVKKARLPARQGIMELNIIDATYSANPDGIMAHLEYLKTLRKNQGKLIIIMPCLIELGSSSKDVHRRIGEKIAEVCDLAIITTKDRFKEIKEGADEKAVFLENPKEIFEKIKNFCQSGDIVLLESRVPSQLIQQLTINN